MFAISKASGNSFERSKSKEQSRPARATSRLCTESNYRSRLHSISTLHTKAKMLQDSIYILFTHLPATYPTSLVKERIFESSKDVSFDISY